jgi:NAD(P)-dependent dehydrogenase (short-subunit alcohol dehydrogenase family)
MTTAIAKQIALITGANSGIGLEIAHQLLTRGTYHVLLGARSLQKGTEALQDLQSRNLSGSIELMQLDLQNDEHIGQTASTIASKHGKLDILFNNAAVATYDTLDGATEREVLQQAFNTNATGPYLLTKALIPLLKKSESPRIINISSGAGSIGRRLFAESPMYKIQAVPYRASKVAFNMITECFHVEFGLGVEQTVGSLGAKDDEAKEEGKEKKRIKVFCYDPGFTVSNLSSHNKKEFGARSVEDTVKSIMELVDGKRDEDVGKFIHNTGEYPW